MQTYEVTFHTIMIPTSENPSSDFPKYIDGICPQDYPRSYQILLNCPCISLFPEVNKIYVHKITMFKIFESCYLKLHIPFRFNYELKNYWHSIVKDELLKRNCQLCETELLQRFQPAYECLDCIEQYLDHIGRINLGYEVKVKNHCFNQIHEEYLNDI